MRKKTLLEKRLPAKDLSEIHDLLLQDRIAEACELYNKSAHLTPDELDREIERERDFILVLSESRRFGTKESEYGITPRQALVWAAICGWNGDGPCSWISPVAREDLIAWGMSHYRGPSAHLACAFTALEFEGLFFEVHPGTFSSSMYYCNFDPDFLEELPDSGEYRELWESFVDNYDTEHGDAWRHNGLCAGQGRQGPSDSSWGPCLGSSCLWFKDGEEACNHALPYKRPAM